MPWPDTLRTALAYLRKYATRLQKGQGKRESYQEPVILSCEEPHASPVSTARLCGQENSLNVC